MLTNPHFGFWRNDVGGYIPDIWFNNTSPSETHYNNDKLIAILLDTVPKYYSQFMQYYGAIGPRNHATYFEREDDCLAFLEILEYLYNEIYINGNSWLVITRHLINDDTDSITSTAEDRTEYYLSNVKTYQNLQSYQGIPMDINYTKKDSKDMNQGHITENPFKPGQSKKPTHYTIL